MRVSGAVCTNLRIATVILMYTCPILTLVRVGTNGTVEKDYIIIVTQHSTTKLNYQDDNQEVPLLL